MAFQNAHYADSDADDEYERSVIPSPRLPTDSESPTDSEPHSTEQTPTTYGHAQEGHRTPKTLILDWSTDECVDFIQGLGLSQYAKAFLENEIVGDALIALKHDELKEMGMASVGHRLTVLKNVYDVKVAQGIPIDPDHYIPLSAEASMQDNTVTQEDIARIIQSIKLRDERIVQAEAELRKVADEYRKLREELLPVFRMAKDQSHPLPTLESHGYDQGKPQQSPPIMDKNGNTLSRKFSKKKLFLGSTPKNSSPTHMPQSIQENAGLDPSAAAMAASSHLTATINGGSQPQTSPKQLNQPSPTSSAYANQSTLASRSYSRNEPTPPTRSGFPQHPLNSADDGSLPHTSFSSNASTLLDRDSRDRDRDRDRSQAPTPGPPGSARRIEETTGSGGAPPSGEIFKSFRVSMDDPCYKVLPAALKKYNINADWRQYALYIVYGDQERCLGLDERPLILFKQLDREGRKPMFMLRRHAPPGEMPPGSAGSTVSGMPPGSAGLDQGSSGGGPPGSSNGGGSGGGGFRGGQQQYQSSIQLPGGVL
ncbi:MAG: hypothetical protein M1819_000407 [Sarea resinae]|nr:MAG: hypothetical protein M1819_000407 [Sarea resinae]